MTPEVKLRRESIREEILKLTVRECQSLLYFLMSMHRVLRRTKCYNTLVSVSKSMHKMFRQGRELQHVHATIFIRPFIVL